MQKYKTRKDDSKRIFNYVFVGHHNLQTNECYERNAVWTDIMYT